MATGPKSKLIRQNLRAVKKLYPAVTRLQLVVLCEISRAFTFPCPAAT
jgi:hypothetical protein